MNRKKNPKLALKVGVCSPAEAGLVGSATYAPKALNQGTRVAAKAAKKAPARS